jgi:hypothetical protein
MKINMGSEQKDHGIGVMILAVSLSILTGTLSGPVALHGFNLFNSFSTPFSLILMSFIGLNGELSINTGQIPEDWKNANIVSIFRKGDRSKPSNYRPVSLTSVASKILGFNLFISFSTPFSLILMSFIGLNGEFPFDGILVMFSVVNTDVN